MNTEEEPYDRRIIVTRHGERLDGYIHLTKNNCHPYQVPAGKTAPDNWVDHAFPNGVYAPIDSQAPTSIPFPSRPLNHWRHDSPLTVRGRAEAVLLGSQMRERGQIPGRIFVSPALRSVETATAIREGLGMEGKLFVEPALYEFFTRTELPPILSANELAEAGFPVDVDYQASIQSTQLVAPEPYPEYYRRLHNFVRWAIDKYKDKDLLLVAHSTTMDTATRMIRGLPPLDKAAFWRHLMGNLNFSSYLSSVAIERRKGEWWMVEPPPQPTPRLAGTFDWRFMIPDLSLN